jgi:hypothetical protein
MELVSGHMLTHILRQIYVKNLHFFKYSLTKNFRIIYCVALSAQKFEQ